MNSTYQENKKIHSFSSFSQQKQFREFSRIFSTSSYTDSLEPIVKLKGHRECVNALAFHKHKYILATGSDDSTTKLWNYHSGDCLSTVYGHSTNVFSLSFFPHKSPNDLLSGGNDSFIIHHSIEQNYGTYFTHHRRKVMSLCVNQMQPDCFMSCSFDGTVRLFDTRMHYPGTITRPTTKRAPFVAKGKHFLSQADGGGFRSTRFRINALRGSTFKSSLGFAGRKEWKKWYRNKCNSQIPLSTQWLAEDAFEGYNSSLVLQFGDKMNLNDFMDACVIRKRNKAKKAKKTNEKADSSADGQAHAQRPSRSRREKASNTFSSLRPHVDLISREEDFNDEDDNDLDDYFDEDELSESDIQSCDEKDRLYEISPSATEERFSRISNDEFVDMHNATSDVTTSKPTTTSLTPSQSSSSSSSSPSPSSSSSSSSSSLPSFSSSSSSSSSSPLMHPARSYFSTFELDERRMLHSVDIHPNGTTFAVACGGGTVQLFDLRMIVDHRPELSVVNMFWNSNDAFRQEKEGRIAVNLPVNVKKKNKKKKNNKNNKNGTWKRKRIRNELFFEDSENDANCDGDEAWEQDTNNSETDDSSDDGGNSNEDSSFASLADGGCLNDLVKSDMTGCAFDPTGTKIAVQSHSNGIFVFDVEQNILRNREESVADARHSKEAEKEVEIIASAEENETDAKCAALNEDCNCHSDAGDKNTRTFSDFVGNSSSSRFRFNKPVVKNCQEDETLHFYESLLPISTEASESSTDCDQIKELNKIELSPKYNSLSTQLKSDPSLSFAFSYPSLLRDNDRIRGTSPKWSQALPLRLPFSRDENNTGCCHEGYASSLALIDTLTSCFEANSSSSSCSSFPSFSSSSSSSAAEATTPKTQKSFSSSALSWVIRRSSPIFERAQKLRRKQQRKVDMWLQQNIEEPTSDESSDRASEAVFPYHMFADEEDVMMTEGMGDMEIEMPDHFDSFLFEMDSDLDEESSLDELENEIHFPIFPPEVEDLHFNPDNVPWDYFDFYDFGANDSEHHEEAADREIGDPLIAHGETEHLSNVAFEESDERGRRASSEEIEAEQRNTEERTDSEKEANNDRSSETPSLLEQPPADANTHTLFESTDGQESPVPDEEDAEEVPVIQSANERVVTVSEPADFKPHSRVRTILEPSTASFSSFRSSASKASVGASSHSASFVPKKVRCAQNFECTYINLRQKRFSPPLLLSSHISYDTIKNVFFFPLSPNIVAIGSDDSKAVLYDLSKMRRTSNGEATRMRRNSISGKQVSSLTSNENYSSDILRSPHHYPFTNGKSHFRSESESTNREKKEENEEKERNETNESNISSDDAVVSILQAHENVVNCVVQSPLDGTIATSGIDCYVVIWKPGEIGVPLTQEEKEAKRKKIKDNISQSKNKRRTGFEGCVVS
ncbi:putative WD and tetratricopeptide repeats protein 1 [Monocercomonoides exilis]|uniref:putative WD and tetratricopeptide repeats protein 1 n=1 Tax=Monocercomonoides exilis TaxID=2049356 RepID=UPI00355AB3E8|nr:putative WD and tetratricopeptide repeats protein 1 [Monocercomonoides exilis]